MRRHCRYCGESILMDSKQLFTDMVAHLNACPAFQKVKRKVRGKKFKRESIRRIKFKRDV